MSRNWEISDLPKRYQKQLRQPPPPTTTLTMRGRTLKSLNALLNMHWSKRRRYKQSLKQHLVLAGAQPSRPPKTGKTTVSITRVLGARERTMDTDNFIGSTKALVDLLVEFGYARDDTPDAITVSYAQDDSRRADGPSIEVGITQPEDDDE